MQSDLRQSFVPRFASAVPFASLGNASCHDILLNGETCVGAFNGSVGDPCIEQGDIGMQLGVDQLVLGVQQLYVNSHSFLV